MAEIQKILDVARPIEESRINGLEQAISVYESSSRTIAHTFELCKRKIAESNGMESKHIMKKKKVEQIADISQNSENVDPNIITIKDEKKHSQGILKEFKKESECAQSILLDSNSVLSMRVVELREELMRRNLDTKGVKKVLQNRLNEALETDRLKDEKRPEYIEDVDMISEKCTEVDEVGKDKVTDSTMSNNNLANDVVNSKTFTYTLDSENTHSSEAVPMTDVEFDETKITPSNVHTDDEIMEGQSTSLIADASTDQYCAKRLESQKNSGSMEDEVNSDPKDCTPQNDKSATEEDIEVGKYTEQNESKDPANVSNIHSTKKGLGHKLFKATSKLFSPKKNYKSQGAKSPGINGFTNPNMIDMKGGTDESQHEKSSTPLKTDPIHKCRRGSISCDMSITDIHAHEVMEKSQIVQSIPEEKGKSSKSLHDKPNSEKKQVVQPGSKASSKIPKAITKPIVSGKTGTESTIKKARALQDARKARLAEIREKASKSSKVVTLANNSKSSATLQKKTHTNTMAKNEIRKKVMAAEMRQKVAEATKQKPEPSKLEQNALAAFKQKQKVMSPMDTYEMSDRGESDSDTEDESDFEEKSSKKKIPKWAQKVNLLPALEKQFLGGTGQHKVDPDEIFPEVSSCDLEAIFDKKKKRYLKRSSTGNWTKDSVTASEKLVYKRKMGFKK